MNWMNEILHRHNVNSHRIYECNMLDSCVYDSLCIQWFKLNFIPKYNYTNLNVSSLQWGADSPLERTWTPESPKSLWLKSSSIRVFGDCRRVATIPQDWTVSVHSANLPTSVTRQPLQNIWQDIFPSISFAVDSIMY